MSGFVPRHARGRQPEENHPSLLQTSLSREEQLRRWEVRAAQWRARELAEEVFGTGVESSLIGLRTRGALRGLLQLDVPFTDLTDHRERESRFLASVYADPLLSRVPLVFVVGPAAA